MSYTAQESKPLHEAFYSMDATEADTVTEQREEHTDIESLPDVPAVTTDVEAPKYHQNENSEVERPEVPLSTSDDSQVKSPIYLKDIVVRIPKAAFCGTASPVCYAEFIEEPVSISPLAKDPEGKQVEEVASPVYVTRVIEEKRETDTKITEETYVYPKLEEENKYKINHRPTDSEYHHFHYQQHQDNHEKTEKKKIDKELVEKDKSKKKKEKNQSRNDIMCQGACHDISHHAYNPSYVCDASVESDSEKVDSETSESEDSTLVCEQSEHVVAKKSAPNGTIKLRECKSQKDATNRKELVEKDKSKKKKKCQNRHEILCHGVCHDICHHAYNALESDSVLKPDSNCVLYLRKIRVPKHAVIFTGGNTSDALVLKKVGKSKNGGFDDNQYMLVKSIRMQHSPIRCSDSKIWCCHPN